MKRMYECFLRRHYALPDDCVLVVPDEFFELAETFLRMLATHIPASRWELRRLEFDCDGELHIEVQLSELATDYHRNTLVGIANNAQYRLKVMSESAISN